MFVFRATQKVIKASGKIELADVEQNFDSELSEWYVNRIAGGERGKFVMVFIHAATQTVIITTDKSLKKAFISFQERLLLLLERQYFKPDFIKKNFDIDSCYIVTKTASRKILGQQNDAIKDVKFWMESYDCFDDINWSRIEDSLFKKLIWVGNNEVSEPRKLWVESDALMSPDEIEKYRLNKSEELMMDNAVMRLQIESHEGAHIEKSANLPPEIENMFLNRIMAFEEASKNPKYITVRKLCGDIDFPNSDALDDMELEEMFDIVIDKLGEGRVAIDFLAEYDTKTKYDFIVNELLDFETADIPIKDMVHGFIYEEFHPNAKMDIESRIEELMEFLIKEHEEVPDLMWFADGEIFINEEKCNGQRVIERYNEFVAANIWPENFKYYVKSIWHDDAREFGKAEVELSNSNGLSRTIEIKLKCTHNWWEITELNV